MLDSGASSNFLSRAVVDGLGVKVNTSRRLTVRLANGKMLNTIGSIGVMVAVGPM